MTQDTICNPHADAPHGFNRNSSHNEGRYVCDCEGWQPDEDKDAKIEAQAAKIKSLCSRLEHCANDGYSRESVKIMCQIGIEKAKEFL